MSVYAPAHQPMLHASFTMTITGFAKRHAVLTYYSLAFAISWGVLLLIIYAQGGIPATQDEFARQVSFAIPAMLGGPGIAGILMTALVSGKTGFRDLFAGCFGGGWAFAGTHSPF